MINEILPTSERVLRKLALAILPSHRGNSLPDREDLDHMVFLWELFRLRDRDCWVAWQFFEYFCISGTSNDVTRLMQQFDTYDYVSESLESLYARIIADANGYPLSLEPADPEKIGEHWAKNGQSYISILAREFRKARGLPPDTRLQVSFPRDEEAIVILEGCRIWRMDIGSDDDGFWFRDLDGKLIEFPMPQDWLHLEETL